MERGALFVEFFYPRIHICFKLCLSLYKKNKALYLLFDGPRGLYADFTFNIIVFSYVFQLVLLIRH